MLGPPADLWEKTKILNGAGGVPFPAPLLRTPRRKREHAMDHDGHAPRIGFYTDTNPIILWYLPWAIEDGDAALARDWARYVMHEYLRYSSN